MKCVACALALLAGTAVFATTIADGRALAGRADRAPVLVDDRDPAGAAVRASSAGSVSSSASACGAVSASVSTSGFDIAITLDDLPWVNRLGPGDSRDQAMARVLAALARHHVPATGFVVCGRMDRALLEQWTKAGLELGNHSLSHPHLDRIDLETWRQEVCGCDDSLAAITGRPPRFFRYPFLQTGRTTGRCDSALAVVRASGHEVAHVSVDTGEWALVAPYVAALEAGDRTLAGEIGQAYVDHVMAAVRHYREIAAARTGGEIGHVLLLHANALAADHLDALLGAIENEGGRFIPLVAALDDPVYRRPDAYAGPIGLSWLYRFPPVVDSLWTWDDDQVRAMQERFPAE